MLDGISLSKFELCVHKIRKLWTSKKTPTISTYKFNEAVLPPYLTKKHIHISSHKLKIPQNFRSLRQHANKLQTLPSASYFDVHSNFTLGPGGKSIFLTNDEQCIYLSLAFTEVWLNWQHLCVSGAAVLFEWPLFPRTILSTVIELNWTSVQSHRQYHQTTIKLSTVLKQTLYGIKSILKWVSLTRRQKGNVVSVEFANLPSNGALCVGTELKITIH